MDAYACALGGDDCGAVDFGGGLQRAPPVGREGPRADTSLGRLLNFCDDILGHGLKVLVLLTTNEDVGRAAPGDHPSRPVLERPTTLPSCSPFGGSAQTRMGGLITISLSSGRKVRHRPPGSRSTRNP
jgi:hypothetical protein